MNVFAKIFAQIFDSSIANDPAVRHIFMDLLVLADRDGIVDMTLDAISRRTNVPEHLVAHAIGELIKPDTKSRSHEEDGRRLVALDSHRDWGWQIVNFDHYRNIRDEESRRAYFRDYKRTYRARPKKSTKVHSGKKSPHVSTRVLDSPTQSTEEEAEGEVDTKQEQKPSRAKRERAPKEPTKTSLATARHAEFKAIVGEYWASRNREVQMPWDGREGKHLEMFLRAAPDITADQFRSFLRNRYQSEVNHGERPSQWLQWVTSYGAGPMDRFGKTIHPGGQNGRPEENRPSAAKQRIDGARRVLAEIAIERGLIDPTGLNGQPGAALSLTGPRGEHPRVSEGLRETSPEILPPKSRSGA